MIVVDTSVWIDVLAGRRTRPARRCVELIEGGEPLALTDVVFTEVLQGLPSEDEARLVERHLRASPVLRLQGLEDLALAAGLYRTARRKGVTIRKTLDCLIAAPCVRTGAPLLSRRCGLRQACLVHLTAHLRLIRLMHIFQQHRC